MMEMRDRGLTGLGEIQAILEHYQMDLQNEVRRVIQDPICVEEAIACAEERIYSAAKYSLQGTTQGNGLTGGLPPVRFSM